MGEGEAREEEEGAASGRRRGEEEEVAAEEDREKEEPERGGGAARLPVNSGRRTGEGGGGWFLHKEASVRTSVHWPLPLRSELNNVNYCDSSRACLSVSATTRSCSASPRLSHFKGLRAWAECSVGDETSAYPCPLEGACRAGDAAAT